MHSPPINADLILSVDDSNVLNCQVKQFTFNMNGLQARGIQFNTPGTENLPAPQGLFNPQSKGRGLLPNHPQGDSP